MKIITLIVMLLTLCTQQLDKPYRFAAAGPKTFDCSGFVVFCYKQTFDIDLPHSAKKIGYSNNYCTINEIAQLKEGDIVCFNTNRGDGDLSDHVGIYIGNNYFIHCSSGKHKVVISPLNEGYYNERFSWGKRILEEEFILENFEKYLFDLP